MFDSKLIVILALVLVGIFCERKKVFSGEQAEGIQLFLYHIGIPCFLFSSIIQQDLTILFKFQFVLSYIISFILISILSYLLFYNKESKAKMCMRIFTSGYVNTAIYVIPVLTIILKDPIAGVITNLLQVILIQTFFVVILSFMKHKEKSLFSRIFLAFTTPIVIFPLIALVCNYCQINVHQIIFTVIQSLGSGSSNIALFAFGLMLGEFRISKNRLLNIDTIAIVFLKCFAHPLLSFFTAKYLFNLEGYWLYAIIIASSGPAAFSSYRIATSYNVDRSFVKDIIPITSVTSLCVLVILASIFPN